ncbi:MAG: AAA family ATPase [Bacteroidota bacterium]
MEKAFLKLSTRHRAVLAATPTKFRRFLLGEIKWDSSTIAVLGPRGVGKTTLLAQRLRDLGLPPEKALYLDLGDLIFQDIRLIDFAEYFLENGGEYLFLDEVHRYAQGNWATEVKSLHDYYRSRLKVVFSGSSVLRILNASADLSRRVHFYHLPGLSFREYLTLKDVSGLPTYSLEDVLGKTSQILSHILDEVSFEPLTHFRQYLERGYYGFVIEDEHGYYDQINQMVQLVLGEDIPHAPDRKQANTVKLSRLLQAVASSVPFKPNISKLASRIELSRNTIVEYLGVLDQAGIISQLCAEGKGISVLGKPDKIYLDNSNLVYALAPQRAEIGTVRETFFLNQLNNLKARKLAFPPEISLPKQGDFKYKYQGNQYIFEVGGPNKQADQIGNKPGFYTVVDAKATAAAHRVPLWLFGLMY